MVNSDGSTPLHTLLRICPTKAILRNLRYLVKHGVDVNLGDPMGNTPLHILLEFGGLEPVVRCLVQSGAYVNAKNELGVTPLMAAVTVTFRYLLKKGANPNIVDVSGCSIVHRVALHSNRYSWLPKSDLLVLIQELLLAGADPMFKSAPSSNEERQQYVPCPLYLAASWGWKGIVEELLKHPQCSPVCKAEAHLLLASTDCDENGLSLHTQELWSKALCIYEENNIHPTYLPPIEAYGNRVEIQSIDQLQELCSSSTSHHEAYYQSLIIQERCIGTGVGCFSLIKALQKRGEAFLEQRKSAEAEQLFLHAVDVVIHDIVLDRVEVYDEKLMNHYCSQIIKWLDRLTSEKYVPSFEHFVKCAIRLHDALLRRNISEEGHIQLIFRVVLVLAISITACCDDTTLQALGSSHVCYTLEELGHDFVSKLLQEPTTLNILHKSLSLFFCENYEYKRRFRGTQMFTLERFYIFDDLAELANANYNSTMLNALLRWGADRIIDQPNSTGQRFLHLAVQSDYATSLVPILLEHNPHLDAVDANGKTALDMCMSDELRSLFPSDPLPLTCQAAKVVVSERIPYRELDLPAHIKTLISLHDCKAHDIV